MECTGAAAALSVQFVAPADCLRVVHYLVPVPSPFLSPVVPPRSRRNAPRSRQYHPKRRLVLELELVDPVGGRRLVRQQNLVKRDSEVRQHSRHEGKRTSERQERGGGHVGRRAESAEEGEEVEGERDEDENERKEGGDVEGASLETWERVIVSGNTERCEAFRTERRGRGEQSRTDKSSFVRSIE